MHPSFFVPKVLAVLFVLVAAIPAGAAEVEPRVLVERFQGNLLAVMKEAETLGVKGRYDRLVSSIEETFYLPLMIRIASGPYWKGANQTQRSRLISAFRRMSVSRVATLFDGYAGETFEAIGEKPGPQNTLLVKTRIVIPDKSSVNLTYVAKAIKERWRLIDIIIDNGISELSVRRSEYRRVLQKEGVDGLIATLNKKADELIAQ
ncbi:MAG: ABC transporter substrate-binding protein [Alphaproteobacteria bacterium]|nr:ABC transporter substrate-binding protein [Alphaproteobacteria bacterium]